MERGIQLTTQSEAVIKTDELPTAIIHDFQAFLAYVKDHNVKLTKTREYLTRKDLQAIYSLLENRQPAASPNGNQDDYPHIHLYFHLASTLGLTYKKGSKSSISLLIDTDRVAAYQELTTAEQYVTLLDTFWTKTDWEELQKRQIGKAPSNIDFLLEYLEKLSFAKTNQVNEDLDRLLVGYENFLYYFCYFGFWEMEPKSRDTEKMDYSPETEPESIKLTPFFKSLIPALVEIWDSIEHISGPLDDLMVLFDQVLNEEREATTVEAKEDSESLFTLLQPFFANGELKTTLLVPGEGEPVTGNFTLNVSLNPSCWRKLRMPSSATLMDLHNLIQKAFAFDDDHLYSFFMDGKRFSKHAYHSPMDMEGPYVQDKEIGRLNLYEGKRFLYLFDFGDEWELYITVEKIEEEEEKAAAIVEKKGKDPEQYEW